MSSKTSMLFPSARSVTGASGRENDPGGTRTATGQTGHAGPGSPCSLITDDRGDGKVPDDEPTSVGEGGTSTPSAKAGLEESDSGSCKLDWLTNNSFRSDRAITIAKQHLERTTGKDRQEGDLHHETSDDNNSGDNHTRDHSAAVSGASNDLQNEQEHRQLHSPTQHQRKRNKKHKHSRDNENELDSRRSSHKKHHRDRHQSHKKRKHSKKSRKYDSSSESSEERDVGNRESIKLTEKPVVYSADDGFCIDVKSDKNNLCFDSLHFTDAVSYYRLGNSCLGLNRSSQSVVWRTTKSKKKHKPESKQLRYFIPGCVEPEEGEISGVEGSEMVQMDQKNISAKDAISYIPIHHPKSKPRPNFDPHGIYDPSTKAYLGSNPSPNLDKSQPDSTAFTVESALTKTTALYNKHLHENPHDVSKWLEFTRFQDTAEFDRQAVVGSNEADSKQTNRKRTVKLIAEKKLAILDKALLKNPNNVPLQLEQLEIGKEFWDVSEQTRQWEKLLKSNRDDIVLWREYLLFKQACFSSFSVSKVAGLNGKCFKALISKWRDLEGSEAANIENQLLDLFVSLCHLWRQAGHTEKAVAAFQAMIELNCFCPSQFRQDTHLEGQIAFLETFWDSSEPRFGEKGAKGWASWMQKKERGGWEEINADDTVEPTVEPPSPTSLSSNQPLWQAWVKEEVSREQTQCIPWCPNESKGETEEDCEDPERMVLFDDITRAIFRLTSQQKHFQLILLFLDFLGVSVPKNLMPVINSTSIYLEQPNQIFSSVADSLTLSGISQLSWASSGVAANCRSLEEVVKNHENKTETNAKDPRAENKALENFVEDLFDQAIPIFPESAQTQLLLLRLDFRMQSALMTADNKQHRRKRFKEAKKFAKALLSQDNNRNNLELWAALAKWEHFMGNSEEAKRVLETAVMFLGQPWTETEQQSAMRLAQIYAELFVSFDSESSSTVASKHSSNAEVLHLLTGVSEGIVSSSLKDTPGKCVSSTRILKARRNYQDLVTRTLSTLQKENCETKDTNTTEKVEWCKPSGSHIMHLTKCFAVFQYLSVGMQAASVVFESSLSALKKSSATLTNSTLQLKIDLEILTEAHVRLLSCHVYSNPTPLGGLRNLIRTSLMDFPSNPALLEAFIYSETKSHIAGRVRRYFDHATRQSGGPVQWLYAIRAELLRQESVLAATASATDSQLAQPNEVFLPETGISNRIRSLFDRASESPHSRHCVLLWRMYMQFEVQQGNLKRAESIFYSALQHCPWAKVLYVDAVRYFPSKLQDCQDLLMEKELHVRAPLEEVELLIKH